MKQPTIEIIPLRPALCPGATLDVLLKITPPVPDAELARPQLNLGLVLDRSGSMGSRNKMAFARDAAVFAIEQLLPTDRVSVTIFDDKIETLAANALAVDKGPLVALIRGIEPRGSTALHGGWQEGGNQVRQNLIAGGLNRVLLLSDGIANVGLSEPDALATDVHRLAAEGVSTTTLGLGDDYNEDLLEAMAQSGDGNYYYIEHPTQLPTIFETELRGLMAAVGNGVTLKIEPCEGVSVADVLNDFERQSDGSLKLPNLVAGMPVTVLIRLNVSQGGEVCRFRLERTAPKQADRQVVDVSLVLPAVSASAWESLAPNVEVQERVVLLRIARLKKEATRLLQQGDIAGATRVILEAKQLLASAPNTPEILREIEAVDRLEANIRDGNLMKFSKQAKYESYRRRSSKMI
jgi:Ca-activated chloride channel homolog